MSPRHNFIFLWLESYSCSTTGDALLLEGRAPKHRPLDSYWQLTHEIISQPVLRTPVIHWLYGQEEDSCFREPALHHLHRPDSFRCRSGIVDLSWHTSSSYQQPVLLSVKNSFPRQLQSGFYGSQNACLRLICTGLGVLVVEL